MQPRLVKWSTTRLSSKFIKECSDGKSSDMWWLWLHSVSSNRLENQLERQELLFPWWLISDQQMRSHWGKTKLNCHPFIFLFFSFSDWWTFSSGFNLAHTCRSRLFCHNLFFPAFNPLCVSPHFAFLSPSPFHTSIIAFLSPFSLFPSSFPCFGFVKEGFISRPEWRRSTGSTDNGPIIRGKPESMKEEQRPLCPRGAPLCTSH